jgi:site-specific recombinase XerD
LIALPFLFSLLQLNHLSKGYGFRGQGQFHDLRHACASLLIQAGEDLYAVGEVLGHKNVQTTKRYAHLQMDRKRAAVDKIGAMVSAKTAP